MSKQFIRNISYEEIEEYANRQSMYHRTLFLESYSNALYAPLSIHTMLNYIVDGYNRAVRYKARTVNLFAIDCNDPDYERLCQYVIPFFEEKRGIRFSPSKERSRHWDILKPDQTKCNTEYWLQASLSTPFGEPLLRMKE